MVAGVCTSMATPPWKSMPVLSPGQARAPREAADNTRESTMPRPRTAIKRIGRRRRSAPSQSGPGRVSVPRVWPRSRHSISRRVTEIDVNSDTTRPTAMVTAKPRTGPAPNWNSKPTAIRVVILESRMVA